MIKRCLLFFAMFAVTFTAVAQSEEGSSNKPTKDYNKWTIELAGGGNVAAGAFSFGPSGREYAAGLLAPWTVDLGVRYMFNNKFGVKLSGGYDSFSNAKISDKFNSASINAKAEIVSNLGRVMNFEEWTSDLGLLAHVGLGYGHLSGKEKLERPHYGFVVFGLTPQVRISNRVTLFVDASMFVSFAQGSSFDAAAPSLKKGYYYGKAVNGHLTGGISVALGKHGRHADWSPTDDSRIARLEGRVANLEAKATELENRVVANTINDANSNRVADEVEALLESEYAKKTDLPKQQDVAEVDAAGQLLNKEYLSIYFDFGSSVPQKSSGWASSFVVRYLRNNPSATVSIEGFADELGSKEANQKLSEKRVEVAKQLLIDAGIDAKRITTVAGKGVDSSVNKSSAPARQIARRATYKLN